MSAPPTRTKRNVTTAVAEVVVTGVMLFLTYSVIVRQLGLSQLGGWSILTAMSGVARVGEAGFAAAPVRFVSRFRARGEYATASRYGQTAIITVAVLMIAILALAAWPIAQILRATVKTDLLDELLMLIPLTLLGTWLLSVSSAVQACLDGAERVDLRTYAQMTGVVVFFVAVVMLVPHYGLSGLAWALVIQAAVVLTWSLFMAARVADLAAPWAWRWSRPAFRDMFSYGLHLQISSIAVVLFEPVTKALLARFSDLSLVGLFEMVSRLVAQGAALLTAANRALVPVYARIAEREPAKGRLLFHDAFMVSLLIATPVFGALVVFSPDIGRIWIGTPSREFVWLAGVVCLGRWLNTLIAPAYFANLGQGFPAPNALGHVAMATANLLLGVLAGLYLGGGGIAWAYALSLVLGAVIIQVAFMRRNALPLATLAPSVPALVLLAVSLATGLVAVIPSASAGLRIAQAIFIVVTMIVLVWAFRTESLLRRVFSNRHDR